MDDLAKKLNELLNSPDGMQKLQQAAASLGQMMGNAGEESAAVPTETPPPPAAEPIPAPSSPPLNEGEGLEGLGDTLGDMAAIARILPLLSGMKKDDENTTLLKALRPYLQSERQQRLDETIKIMHMLQILPLLGGQQGGNPFGGGPPDHGHNPAK